MSEAQTELDNQRAADDVQERELVTAAREARKTAEHRNARRAARQAAQLRAAQRRHYTPDDPWSKPPCDCYPHGPQEPCTCTGCRYCPGHKYGCTCDINWACTESEPCPERARNQMIHDRAHLIHDHIHTESKE